MKNLFFIANFFVFFFTTQALALERPFDGYIVKFKKNAHVLQTLKSFASDSSVINTSFGKFAKIKNIPQVKIKSFTSNPEIEYIEPNWIVKASVAVSKPNDEGFRKQWALSNSVHPGFDVKALEAWGISKGSRQIKIAIIDSGIDYNHPDLKNQMDVNEEELKGTPGVDDDGNGVIDDIYGYNSIDDSGDPMDDNDHGTHCAGIVGAAHDGKGVAGIMGSVSLVAIKFLNNEGSGSIENAIKSIDYAIKRHVNIISNSWGGAGVTPRALTEAIQAASDKGILFIVAAGNEDNNNDETSFFPANAQVSNVISVGAIDPDGSVAKYSNYGRKTVHILAPGTDIFSTIPGGEYETMSGTSMATPLIAGIAGLVLSVDSTLKPIDVKKIMSSTAITGELYNSFCASGLVNAEAALLKASDSLKFSPKIDTYSAKDGTMNISYSVQLTENQRNKLTFIKIYLDEKLVYSFDMVRGEKRINASSELKNIDPATFYSKATFIRFDLINEGTVLSSKSFSIAQSHLSFDVGMDSSVKLQTATISTVFPSYDIYKSNRLKYVVLVENKIISSGPVEFGNKTYTFVVNDISKKDLILGNLKGVVELRMDDKLIESKSIQLNKPNLEMKGSAEFTDFLTGQMNFTFNFTTSKSFQDSALKIQISASDSGAILFQKDYLAQNELQVKDITNSFGFDPYDLLMMNYKPNQQMNIDIEFFIEGISVNKFTHNIAKVFIGGINSDGIAKYFSLLLNNLMPSTSAIALETKKNEMVNLLSSINNEEVKRIKDTKVDEYKDKPYETLLGKLVLYKADSNSPFALAAWDTLGRKLEGDKKELSLFKRNAYKKLIEKLLIK